MKNDHLIYVYTDLLHSSEEPGQRLAQGLNPGLLHGKRICLSKKENPIYIRHLLNVWIQD